MYIIIYEADCKSKFDAWDRVPRAVHWYDPGGRDGEGGRRGILDLDTICVFGLFMSMYGKTHYNIVM